MGDSNGAWGELAGHDQELADAWDGYERLPEPGQHEALDAFCDRKRITHRALLRLGTKLADHEVLAFQFPGGIKFRDIVSDRRWSYFGSDWTAPKIIKAGHETADTAIVCEGETDGARLVDLFPECDVAVMPGGAKYFPVEWAEHLTPYSRVLVGLDPDEAGDHGAARIAEVVPHAQRFAPPDGDWCETDNPPALPEPVEVPEPLPMLVTADRLLTLEEPDVVSWYENALLPVGGTMILHGWVKSFKSMLAFDLMSQLAQGEPWANFEPTEEACNVAVIQYEIPWPFYRQRVLQLQAHAADADTFGAHYHTWDPLRRPKLVAGDTKAEDAVLSELLGADIQVVLIDPIRRMGRGVDFNEEKEIARVLGFFERLNDEGITVVATHHDNKEGGRSRGGDPIDMTGSGALAGDPDTLVSVELPRGEDRRTSTRRNLQITLRNAPAVSARGMEVQDNGNIQYTDAWGGDEEDDDPTAPAI